MGTSLLGLVPSTTYSALLKLGDNSGLTNVLKVISDGAGTDSVLALSTLSLQIGGATGATWDNTNKRLGIGTSTPTSALDVTGRINITGDILVSSNVRGTLASALAFYAPNGGIYAAGIVDNYFAGNIAIGTTAASAKTHIKGSGSTSATTSLLVQNSASTNLMTVLDNGNVGIGTSTPGAPLEIRSASGSTALRIFANSVSVGYDLYPTSAGGLFFYQQGSSSDVLSLHSTGRVSIGTTTDLSARLGIKGSGATSATTSLLVQNSAGTAALTVKDDLNIDMASGGQLNVPNGGILSQGGVKANDSSWGVGWNNSSTWGIRGDSGKIGFGSGTTGAGALDTAISRNAAGVLEVNNGTMGTLAAINVSSYKVNGTSGFTGTGTYTSFTIVGGIITNAT